jgi:aminoglycoside 6'-N-acetyltransferase I
VTIRSLRNGADARIWAALRRRLWPHASADELLAEAKAFAAKGETPMVAAAFLAEDERKTVVGFIELSIRPFADGCESRPIAHVEGWYIEPHARGRGLGRALMRRAEDWSRKRGFRELASDTEIGNDVSLRAHVGCGFAETERLVKLRKRL